MPASPHPPLSPLPSHSLTLKPAAIDRETYPSLSRESACHVWPWRSLELERGRELKADPVAATPI
jgi:hypothetical protein